METPQQGKRIARWEAIMEIRIGEKQTIKEEKI